MVLHANVAVIVDGFGSGEQNDVRFFAELGLGAADELFADAPALVGVAHSEIGEVGAIAPIGERARDADEQVAVPGSDGEISFVEHLLHAGAIVDGAALAEGGGDVEVEGGIEVERRVGAICNRH